MFIMSNIIIIFYINAAVDKCLYMNYAPLQEKMSWAMANVPSLLEKCFPTKTCNMFQGNRNRHNCTKLKGINFHEHRESSRSTQEQGMKQDQQTTLQF